MSKQLLSLRQCGIQFHIADSWRQITRDISFEVAEGESVALVGESGSGKSVTAMSILGLLPENAIIEGEINFDGRNLAAADKRVVRRVRGNEIAMIFQEPMTALNPVYTVGDQICDVLRHLDVVEKGSLRDEAVRLLREVHMPDPERKFDSYIHQLSGGQRQRAMVAMAISGSPRLLIADEPTTALDVTVQAEILDLLRERQAATGMGLLLITHDMGVVADVASRAAVMENGRLVEQAAIDDLFANPKHPYTQKLLSAVPRLHEKTGEPTNVIDNHALPALEVKGLDIVYGKKSRKHDNRAVKDVSLSVRTGEILGLVGESGSGKTSIGRSILGLVEMDAGSVLVNGNQVNYSSRKRIRSGLGRVAMVFQDPASSLNPRLPIWRIISNPLRWGKVERRRSILRKKAQELLEMVDMPETMADRYPHELSGGQRQRVGIARALITEPVLVIADEPTSALDVSVQATVLDLLRDIQRKMEFACLFISHDLAVVELLADRVAVLQNGGLVEVGGVREVLSSPSNDYTKRLIAAAPVPDPQVQRERRRKRLTTCETSPESTSDDWLQCHEMRVS